MGLTRFIHVRTQIEGLHHWPAADGPHGYLATPHRHLFVATLDVDVDHDDREIEINALTRWLTNLLPTLAHTEATPAAPIDFGPQSCEQLATRITHAVLDQYGHHRAVRCTVLEDGILGGGVQWQPGNDAA